MKSQALRDLNEEYEARRAQKATKSLHRMTGITFTSAEHYRSFGERVHSDGDDPRRLVNCDLSGLDLRCVDMSYTVFDACRLVGTRLDICHHAEFYSSDLRKADLAGADFRWVKTLNCRFDGADLLGIQVTVNCDLRLGMRTDLNHDAYLMLYWLAMCDNPLLKKLAEENIPARARSVLDAQFRRGL